MEGLPAGFRVDTEALAAFMARRAPGKNAWSTPRREADEVRIVATTDEIVGFCRSMRARIKATDYYISPLEMDGKMHYRRALNLLMKLKKGMPDAMPPWSLSIQMHKVIGIR